jgi:hypothetical protein
MTAIRLRGSHRSCRFTNRALLGWMYFRRLERDMLFQMLLLAWIVRESVILGWDSSIGYYPCVSRPTRTFTAALFSDRVKGSDLRRLCSPQRHRSRGAALRTAGMLRSSHNLRTCRFTQVGHVLSRRIQETISCDGAWFVPCFEQWQDDRFLVVAEVISSEHERR